MINLQKLRYLSSICAYCNKVIPMEERTNDHIIPRCSGGVTETQNIVIGCQECNGLKGNTLITEFLEMYPDKAECFYNYLNMIDCQLESDEYSSAISEVLSKSQKMYFLRKKRRAKKLKKKLKTQKPQTEIDKDEIQDIEYKYELSGNSFYINKLQSKILDFYLANPTYSDYKSLAKDLGIGLNRLLKEISCINNLTGIFKLKQMSKNGIVLNNLQCEYLYNKISKVSKQV